jgi:peroxiredoxin
MSISADSALAKGAVAHSYGVYRDHDGGCERALFVINRDGLIHWSFVPYIGSDPGANGIFSALKDLKEGGGVTAAAA